MTKCTCAWTVDVSCDGDGDDGEGTAGRTDIIVVGGREEKIVIGQGTCGPSSVLFRGLASLTQTRSTTTPFPSFFFRPMLAAMRSVDDVHVRALLDQRAQRADVPATRFSAFSDRSDSPSLYSHVSNSYPRSPPAFHNSPFTHLNDFHDTGSPTRPVFGHSPAHRFDDPNASELDLSDDRSLSESGSGISPQDEHGDGDYADEEGSSAHADESLLESRLSLMGPKMRVHSRAPWEVDEDPDRDSLFDDGWRRQSLDFWWQKQDS